MASGIEKGYELIARRRPHWTNEEEVRHAWMKGLEEALRIDLDAERARRDSSYNNVVIEFKGPGLFKGSESSPKFREAMEERLLKYIQRLAREQGLDEQEYIGIAIDGDHLAFAQVRNGVLKHQHLLPFSPISFQMAVDALRAGFRRAITAANLAEDFGHDSVTGRTVMQTLSDALGESLNKVGQCKAGMLFEEWVLLYGQVADLNRQQKNKINGTLGFTFNGPDNLQLPAKLCVAHTFHSLLMKLLAAELVAAHGLASSSSLIHDLLALEQDVAFTTALRRDLEQGAFFNAVGLRGFVEEVLFSWYLDAADSSPSCRASLCRALRLLLARLAVYRFDAVQKSGRSRDVLRDFYQNLVPEGLRKSLGEFYTPDWLVEHSVNKLDYDSDHWLTARILDPTCGSGSFLLEVIERKRRAATDAGWPASRLLDMLLETVWGFDINPLAVQSSRVNFLIAVSDLLRECKGKNVEIPVLLADAIYSPATSPGGDQEIVTYRIGNAQAELHVTLPAKLVQNRVLLNQVFHCMDCGVQENREYSSVAASMAQDRILTREQAAGWQEPLKQTYDQVLALHNKNWNGIWLSLIRNFFWSVTAGQFDAIVGNPPWVRWSNLPEAYRNRAKSTCEQYDIFSETKFHGGNELDISALITYTTADKWLAAGGRLVFVITQTVFQSPSSQGFRRFRINASDCLVPLSVDDLKALKPFPGAANKTAVALFAKKRQAKPNYPLEYTVWLGKARQRQKGRGDKEKRMQAIDASLPYGEVLKLVQRTPMEANPVTAEMAGAPWAVMRPGHFASCKSLFGASTWINGRKGITTDLNGVYFVEVVDVNERDCAVKIRTRPQEGKTELGKPREFWIEADSLYPLAKGAGDLCACGFFPEKPLYTLVPNTGIDQNSLTAAAARFTVRSLPKTYQYFHAHKNFLLARSTYRTRMKGAPFFAIYNVGAYTFAPYKVLWAEMTGNFVAAVASSGTVPGCGKRVYVPDHKLYFVAFNEAEPAYFLCGLLHAELVKEMIESHLVATNMGDIFKHINLPEFQRKNPEHLELAALVRQAHGEKESDKRDRLVAKVRERAGKLIDAEIVRRRRGMS